MAIRRHRTNFLDIILNFIMESRKEHLGIKAILSIFFFECSIIKNARDK